MVPLKALLYSSFSFIFPMKPLPCSRHLGVSSQIMADRPRSLTIGCERSSKAGGAEELVLYLGKDRPRGGFFGRYLDLVM